MDTFRTRLQHLDDLRYQSKLYVTHQPGPHSGRTWKGHVKSIIKKQLENPTPQRVWGRKTILFKQKWRRTWPHWQDLSIEKRAGPALIEKTIKIKGFDQTVRLYHSAPIEQFDRCDTNGSWHDIPTMIYEPIHGLTSKLIDTRWADQAIAHTVQVLT